MSGQVLPELPPARANGEEKEPSLFGPTLPEAPAEDPFAPYPAPIFEIDRGASLGFAGPSGIVPREYQADGHFIPVEDRWRTPFPEWDRYDRGRLLTDEYPYDPGHWWDPYHQNVLKGDYPILGQHTFLELTATSDALFEPRQLPSSNSAGTRFGSGGGWIFRQAEPVFLHAPF